MPHKPQRNLGVCSIETLQRRIAYGGKKGRNAERRIRDRRYITDKQLCREFYAKLNK